MKAKRKRKKRGGIWWLLLLSLLVVWTLWANTALVVTRCTFVSQRVPAAFDGFVILQVSDLHDAELGEDNSEIADAAAQAQPDIIVITGDHIDSNRLNIARSLSLAARLAQIAPVYYVTGNHEAALSNDNYTELKNGLAAAGVAVLEDGAVYIERGNDAIRLIGLNDLGFYKGTVPVKQQKLLKNLTLLNDESCFSLVLSHRPELIDIYAQGKADLVLCGHAHGGQIRLPFIGGLYSPGQGMLPEYTSGLYRKGDTSIFVSRGIGNSKFPLRFNNRPELAVITLKRG
ncbi:MAG: metallophosphoesterase [Clostridia bacterium]|nr:metallophosphoesterase [Clostridia bacterium]